MVQICPFRNFKSKIGCLISIISEKCKKIYMINRIPSYQCEFSVIMQIIINFLVIWFSYPRRDIALRCQFCSSSMMLCPLLPKWSWWLVSGAFVGWEDSCFSSIWHNLQNSSFWWWFPFEKVLGSGGSWKMKLQPKGVKSIKLCMYATVTFQTFFFFHKYKEQSLSLFFIHFFSVSLEHLMLAPFPLTHFTLFAFFTSHTKQKRFRFLYMHINNICQKRCKRYTKAKECQLFFRI